MRYRLSAAAAAVLFSACAIDAEPDTRPTPYDDEFPVSSLDEIFAGAPASATIPLEPTHKAVYPPQYSALLGFPFWEGRGRLWAGLVQNTGGAQVDFAVVPEKLWLSLEAYDFSRELELDPHVRLTAQWFPWNENLYVKAGWDDPLVDERRSPFVGVGMRWSATIIARGVDVSVSSSSTLAAAGPPSARTIRKRSPY